MDKKQIGDFRQEIDELDQQILMLMNRRACCAQQIGELKKQTNSPVFHPEREMQVIKCLIATNEGPLQGSSIEHIWREIMSGCRALEQKVKVAFLGPQGTFSEEAALAYFGSSIALEHCPDIDAVFKSVSNGNSRFGVVPIENSTEGGVTRSLDLLQQSSLKIVGEIGLRIQHELLSLGADLQKIDVVYAHPQALAQCQGWLTAHLPHVRRQAVSSNAEGARLAALEANAAAIAGKRAAGIHQLQIIAHGIQDVSHNRTRFVVLVKQDEPEPVVSNENMACTSIVVSVPNKPGAVYDLLAPLKTHQVSLTRFESRPARSEQWEYFFYMDIAGHIKQPEIISALQEVRKICTFYKLLGSYSVRPESV